MKPHEYLVLDGSAAPYKESNKMDVELSTPTRKLLKQTQNDFLAEGYWTFYRKRCLEQEELPENCSDLTQKVLASYGLTIQETIERERNQRKTERQVVLELGIPYLRLSSLITLMHVNTAWRDVSLSPKGQLVQDLILLPGSELSNADRMHLVHLLLDDSL